MSDARAFWVKGNKIIKVQNSLHIGDICKNPEIFGFSDKQIKEIYNKYNEKIGTEYKAREEIMVDAMKRGWLRIRERIGKSGTQWIIQYDDFKKRSKNLQEIVSNLALDKKILKKYDRLTLMDINGKVDRDYYDDFIHKGISGTSPLQFLTEEKKERIEEVNNYSCFNY